MSKNFVNLSLQRWTKLRELTPDVDTAVERMLKKKKAYSTVVTSAPRGS